VQGREGPSIVGVFGFGQTAVDGVKTFFKNIVVSRRSAKILFFLLPTLLLFFNFIKILFVPTSITGGVIDFEYDILIIYVLISFDVLVLVYASWVSFTSKFPTISSLREIAQLCSFELVSGFCLLSVVMHAGSLSLRTCIAAQHFVWFFFIITPYAYLFFVVVVAELHRTPVDLSEAESEIVAGYQSEFGGFNFSFFYLAEYSNLLISGIIYVALFLGGWNSVFCWFESDFFMTVKISLLASFLVVIRAASPRIRLVSGAFVAWTQLLPASSGMLPFYMWAGYIFNAIRQTEYVAVAGARRFIDYVTSYYYLSFSLWLRKQSEGDLRKDTAVQILRQYKAIEAENEFLLINDADRNISNTAVSRSRYPIDQELMGILNIGGPNYQDGMYIKALKKSERKKFWSEHSWLLGSMYETFLHIFSPAKSTTEDVATPDLWNT